MAEKPTQRIVTQTRSSVRAFGARNPFTLATITLVIGLFVGWVLG